MLTKAGKKVFYPFPESYVSDLVKKVFRALKRGECVTEVWVAAAGRRVLNRFIVENIKLFEKEIPNYKNYLLVYTEPLDLPEETQAGYLRLIGSSFIEACQKRKDLKLKLFSQGTKIFENENAEYSKLLSALKKLISQVVKQGKEVVLFLGEIDELKFVNTVFCNNLKSLWNYFDEKLHFIFLIKDTRLIFTKDCFGEELSYLFSQNVIYFPVLKENEDYLINYFEKKTGYRLSEEKRTIVKGMCDGHPYFLKLAIETLVKEDMPDSPLPVGKIKELLRSNYEIRSVSRRIIEVQPEEAKKALIKVATKEIFALQDEELKPLISLGLVRKAKEGHYRPFCQLFEDAILEKVLPSVSSEGEKKLLFDSQLNTIIFGGKPVEEKFTRQEYEVLSFFLKEANKVHSRDEIAETIWGKESYEKYSDWAIDQLMSKLRKKLKQIGVDDKVLVTLRGRGYKLVD